MSASTLAPPVIEGESSRIDTLSESDVERLLPLVLEFNQTVQRLTLRMEAVSKNLTELRHEICALRQHSPA